MTLPNQKKGEITAEPAELELIARTQDVPVYSDYSKYRRYLRYDFYYSCAYCSITEAEAEATRLTIDHYEPVSAKPELEAVYSNLMYACEECNSRKGDLSPPPEARDAGYRFFRPDTDRFGEHFSAQEMTLGAKTNTGLYTIAALSLNRKHLRRLRELRLRLRLCDKYVSEGIRALCGTRIDQLHPQIRARASRWINEAADINRQLVEDINAILRAAARSSLIGDDQDADDQDNADRRESLKKMQGLHPGQWRGRQQKAKTRRG